jgi:hypothetical protein
VFVGVLVTVGVSVRVGVSVTVAVSVGVPVEVRVAVFVGVRVCVAVSVFVAVLLGVLDGVAVVVLVGVAVKVKVQVLPKPSVQGVLVTVKVLVGTGVEGATGLFLAGQPMIKKETPIKSEKIPAIRNLMKNSLVWELPVVDASMKWNRPLR